MPTSQTPSSAKTSSGKASSGKVLLGLSGNLLSSVVAALLKHQGFQVLGLHFQTDEASRAEAERIARKLGIALTVEDAVPAVEEYVTDHIVHQVLANRKAEPAVMGHQKILIEGLCAKAGELGCGMIATGHSARVVLDPSTGLTRLVRATELPKDQSHLLFGIHSEQLKQFILPAGDLSAAAIERLTIELELDPGKLSKPSPGFCAIPEERYLAMAEPRIPAAMKAAGQIKTATGSVVGNHEGLFRYVRGQALSELKGKEEALVVTGMIHGTYTLIVGAEEELVAKELIVHRVNWIQKPDPIKGLLCETRLGGENPGQAQEGSFAKSRITPFEHGYLHVEFDQPQRNILPGQAVVFYSGEEVLGGGFAV